MPLSALIVLTWHRFKAWWMERVLLWYATDRELLLWAFAEMRANRISAEQFREVVKRACRIERA